MTNQLPTGKPGRATYDRHNRVVRQTQIAERRQMVAANLIAGMTYTDIAEALGVSIGTVASDVKAVLADYRKSAIEDIKRNVTIQARQLDVLMNAVFQKAAQGEMQSIAAALRIMERRAALLGLDAETRARIIEDDETDYVNEIQWPKLNEQLTSGKPDLGD